jgi:uncharacterized repeat protein (TIGR03943 family)
MGDVVSRQTQGLLMAFLGAVLVRLGMTDAYLRYVTTWMKWPLVVTGVVLLVLGLSVIVAVERHGRATEKDAQGSGDAHDEEGHGHGVPLVTWLLVLPGLMVFVVSPPELGSYLAERRAGETVAAPEPEAVADLTGSGTASVDLLEFVWRAQDGGQTLEGQVVSIDGFVSYDEKDNWYVTKMTIACCAADATGYQVLVQGADRPPRDQWVRVTGTYVSGTGAVGTAPAIAATEVEEIPEPTQTYG